MKDVTLPPPDATPEVPDLPPANNNHYAPPDLPPSSDDELPPCPPDGGLHDAEEDHPWADDTWEEGHAEVPGATTGNPKLRPYTVDYDKEGKLRPSLRTIAAILGHDPRWFPLFRHNVRSGRVEVKGEPLTDTHVGRIALALDESHGVTDPMLSKVDKAIHVVAHADPYDPVRDWLEGLVWDGVERLPTLLVEHYAAEVPPLAFDAGLALLAAYGTCTMIGAVKRTFEPGCQHDSILILYGRGGCGKSTSVKALVPNVEWWSATAPRIGKFRTARDAGLDTSGKWIIEIPEAEKWIGGAEAADAKGYITRPIDRYDDKHVKHAEDRPRRFVFFGTTNEPDVINAATGSRRLWPVTVGADGRNIDVPWIAANRAQLWAEAVHRYREGEPSYLSDELDALRLADTEAFEETDPWEEELREWLPKRDPTRPFFTMKDALNAIGVPPGQREGRTSRRVASLLRRLGYVNRQWKPPGYDHRGMYWGKP